MRPELCSAVWDTDDGLYMCNLNAEHDGYHRGGWVYPVTWDDRTLGATPHPAPDA